MKGTENSNCSSGGTPMFCCRGHQRSAGLSSFPHCYLHTALRSREELRVNGQRQAPTCMSPSQILDEHNSALPGSNPTCTSPLGPWNSSGSVARSKKATCPASVLRRDRLKSMRVACTPAERTYSWCPLQGSTGHLEPHDGCNEWPLGDKGMHSCQGHGELCAPQVNTGPGCRAVAGPSQSGYLDACWLTTHAAVAPCSARRGGLWVLCGWQQVYNPDLKHMSMHRCTCGPAQQQITIVA